MGQHASTRTIDYFLTPLNDGRIDVILEHSHPEVQNSTDEGVLRAVLQDYRQRLGDYDQPNNKVYKSTTVVSGDDKVVTESGELTFANGILAWDVEWKNDKLSSISASVPSVEQTELTIETKSFIDRSLRFINHFYNSDSAEFAKMMSPALAKVVSKADLLRMINLETDRQELGVFKEVKPANIPDTLTVVIGNVFDLTFEIVREKAIGLGRVSFSIEKLEAPIMGFSFCQTLLRSLVHPEPDEGKKLTKKVLQHMINFEGEEYYEQCIKSLRSQVQPEVIKCFWEDVFAMLGPLEETIDEAMERCVIDVTEDESLLPKIVSHGTVKFMNNTFIYEFQWVNGAMLSYNYRYEKEVVGFLRSPVTLKTETYWNLTKEWFLDVIRYPKMDVCAAELLPGFHQEQNTVNQFAVMKNLLKEVWNVDNVDTVEFELVQPSPMPETFTVASQQQYPFKLIMRNADHAFEVQMKWFVGQFRAFISSFYISRLKKELDIETLKLKEVSKLSNIVFSSVTVDVSELKDLLTDDSLTYNAVFLHSRQDIQTVSAPMTLSSDSLVLTEPLFFNVLNWNLIDSVTLDINKVKNGVTTQLGSVTMPLATIVTAKLNQNAIIFSEDFDLSGTPNLKAHIKFEFQLSE